MKVFKFMSNILNEGCLFAQLGYSYSNNRENLKKWAFVTFVELGERFTKLDNELVQRAHNNILNKDYSIYSDGYKVAVSNADADKVNDNTIYIRNFPPDSFKVVDGNYLEKYNDYIKKYNINKINKSYYKRSFIVSICGSNFILRGNVLVRVSWGYCFLNN